MNNSEIHLIGFPPSTFYQTAALALSEKDVQFTMHVPELHKEEYLQVHPFRRVPVLVQGDITIYEALAIAVYADDTFAGPPLQPTDSLARARMFQSISSYLDYGVSSVLNYCVRERFQKMIRNEAPDEQKIRSGIPYMERFCEALECAMPDANYIVGRELTIADLFLIPTMIYFSNTPEGRSLIARRPNVRRWLDTVRARPSVVSTCIQLDWVVE